MEDSLKQQLKKTGYKGDFSLSSLIEACGDRFRTLIYCGCKECKWNVHGDSDIDGWDEENDMRGCFVGKTPEVAVAKLWLKLNPKVSKQQKTCQNKQAKNRKTKR